MVKNLLEMEIMQFWFRLLIFCNKTNRSSTLNLITMKSEQQNVFLKGLPDTCLKSLIQQRKYKQFFRNQAEGDMFTKHLSYCYYR